MSADFRVLVLSVWDWLSSIQSTSFLIFIIKKGGDIITSLTGLVQSPPPPILLFSVSDAVAQSQTSVVSCQDASAKISGSGCWEAFWANEESRCRCCQMCKHSRYVCSSGCKAANGLTEERRLGRGVYDREAEVETASSMVSFPELGNSNSGCSYENVGATWTPKLSCFAIYRSGSKNQGNNTMNVQNMALVKDCYHQPNIYIHPPCFSFTWCNSDFFSCCSDSRAFTWMFPVWKTSLIVLMAHERADIARPARQKNVGNEHFCKPWISWNFLIPLYYATLCSCRFIFSSLRCGNAVLMVWLSWGTKPTLVRVSRRSCFGSKYQMVS